MQSPETHYVKSGDVNIAYQVVGDGPIDLVYVPGWVSHLEYAWEDPSMARSYRRLASFSRLILFDKRGTGLSDRVAEAALPTLEQRMDDVRAVMDTAGSERAGLVGVSEGGPLCALFTATYPERTSALIMIGSYARRMWSEDYPFGVTKEVHDKFLAEIEEGWGGPVGLEVRGPSVWGDEAYKRWWSTYLRLSASPGAALALTKMNAEIDVRNILSAIRVPTLIIHRAGDKALNVEGSRYMAEQIPGAKYVELPGEDHLPWVEDADAILDEVEQFLTGVRPAPEPHRVLATVLFTDIAGSTEMAAELGDSRWRDVLQRYYGLARKELEHYRGREVKTTGDGFLATFDGPARAILCARAVSDSARSLGIETRAGLHTGECEMMGDDVGGIAVHIGARVAAEAAPGQVLVSSTVKDLVAGSGIEFEDRGPRRLKGVRDEWRLFAVRPLEPS